jgi:hypothetical protein
VILVSGRVCPKLWHSFDLRILASAGMFVIFVMVGR